VIKLPREIAQRLADVSDIDRMNYLMEVGEDIGEALALVAIPYSEGMCSPGVVADMGTYHVHVDIDAVIFEMFKRVRKMRLSYTRPGEHLDILEAECMFYD